MRVPDLVKGIFSNKPETTEGGPLEPGADFGVYHVEEHIGSGGFADVYLAVHRLLRRPAALKVIRPDTIRKPGIGDLFVHEAQLAARFSHPNVLQIYDAGKGPGDRFFMALRYVPGGSLRDLVQQGPVPPERALPLMLDCCTGLGAIHAAGLVHRDIKPANILIDAEGRACIADLGLAGLHEEHAPSPDQGSISGTPLFLAPEVLVSSDPPGPPADVYALGITFTALLTGETPLRGLPIGALLVQAAEGNLPDPLELRPELDEDLAQLLRDLTARVPTDRPESGTELLDRIEALADRRQHRAPYAPPTGRAGRDEIAATRDRFEREPLIRAVLDACPGPALLLNRHRQVVTANAPTAHLLGTDELDAVLGSRPGEVLHCEKAASAVKGCGTSPVCRYCGLGRALSDVQQDGDEAVVGGECRVSAGGGRVYEFAFDLRRMPTDDGERLHLVTLRDVSAENRRRVIGHGLVDSLLQTAEALQSLGEETGVNAEASTSSELRASGDVAAAGRALFEEAVFQQHLLAAEEGELRPVCEPCDVETVLRDAREALRDVPLATGREIRITCAPGARVPTDRLLLEHSFRALVKHALSASAEDDRVDVHAAQDADDGVCVRIHQPRSLPPGAEASVFNPSISTRGDAGYDVGTYAARLFVESYLGGRVTFASSEEVGTSFEIHLPAVAPLPAGP